MSTACGHEAVETTYVPDEHTRVTACVACGTEIDRQPLRPKDEPGAVPESPPRRQAVPADVHDEVQAAVREAETYPCAKHGGKIVACSTGLNQAHECHHSSLGSASSGPDKPRTFPGPCLCRPCHSGAYSAA